MTRKDLTFIVALLTPILVKLSELYFMSNTDSLDIQYIKKMKHGHNIRSLLFCVPRTVYIYIHT